MMASMNDDRKSEDAVNPSNVDFFSSGFCEAQSSASSDVSLLWKLSHHTFGNQQLEHIYSSSLSESLNYFKNISTCFETYLKNIFSAYLTASDYSSAIARDKAALSTQEVARNDSLKLAVIDKKLDAILDAITASKFEIINSIQYSQIKPIISYLETLKAYFKAELQYKHVSLLFSQNIESFFMLTIFVVQTGD